MSSVGKALPLSDVHRDAGATFVCAWGLEMPSSFGDPEREYEHVRAAAGLVDQSYRGVIDLEGEACVELLERVLSCRVGDVEQQKGQRACLLTAKGRLIGAFHLFRLAETSDRKTSYRAVLFEPCRETLVKEFQKYALLSDVDVTERTDTVSILSLWGPRAAEFLDSVPGVSEIPSEPLRWCSTKVSTTEVTLVRAGEGPPGAFELWVPAANLAAVWRVLLDSANRFGGGAVGWQAQESLRIEAGFARYGMDYDEESFPNEIGWERALTYDKCYVGQEIVARMRTYGQVNRRLFHVFPEGDDLPSPGTAILSGSAQAGKITSAADSYKHRAPLALGLVKRKFWGEQGLVVDVGGMSRGVKLQELPGQ